MSSSCNTIVVIDVQNGFLSEHTEGIVERISEFMLNCDFEHRIFTRFLNPGDGDFFDTQMGWDKMQLDPEAAIAYHETDIVPELIGMATAVIDKPTYSAFGSLDFARYLQLNRINEAYLCGIDTNVCVLHTAADMFDRRIRPIVISDLCASHSGESYHDAALSILDKFIGSVNIQTSSDVLSGSLV